MIVILSNGVDVTESMLEKIKNAINIEEEVLHFSVNRYRKKRRDVLPDTLWGYKPQNALAIVQISKKGRWKLLDCSQEIEKMISAE